MSYHYFQPANSFPWIVQPLERNKHNMAQRRLGDMQIKNPDAEIWFIRFAKFYVHRFLSIFNLELILNPQGVRVCQAKES